MRIMLTGLALLFSQTAAHSETRLNGDLPVKAAVALESTEGLETEYGMIRTSEGLRLRSFVTRPQGTSERLPAIFVTQWVSCGSMRFSDARDSQLKLLARQSGMVMIRIDRSGSGDSEGLGCDKLDYDTEVRHYREALVQVKQHPWVDPDRVVILGSSLGSTTAPLVAEGNNVAGVVVQGGGAVT
ncbi:CocE/NonD family hydrolase, partial [Parasphingorhabdus sp.]